MRAETSEPQVDRIYIARSIFDELSNLDETLNEVGDDHNLSPYVRREKKDEIFLRKANLVWLLLNLRGEPGLNFETTIFVGPAEKFHPLSLNHFRATVKDSDGNFIGSALTTLYQLADSSDAEDVSEMVRLELRPDVEQEEDIWDYPLRAFAEIRIAERQYRDRKDWNDDRGMSKFSKMRAELIERALRTRKQFPDVLLDRITVDRVPGQTGNAVLLGFRPEEEVGIRMSPSNFVFLDWSPKLHQLVMDSGGYNFINPRVSQALESPALLEDPASET